MQLSLHYATVTNNSDPDEKAKIQVRLLPEMKDFEEAKLPWVRPFLNDGMSDTRYGLNVPADDSKVWVVFTDKHMKEGYYLSGSFVDGFFDYSSVKADLANITELSDTTYPNIRFNRLSDGTIMFHNDETGEVGIYHSSGHYVVIDAQGQIKITNHTEVGGDLQVDGNLSVGNGAQQMTMYTSLEAAMVNLLLLLATHAHSDPMSGTTGPPIGGLLAANPTNLFLTLAESQKSSTD